MAAERWPTGTHTIFFDNVASRTTLSKAVRNGRIRRIAARVYSADLRSDPAEIVGANWSELCSHYLPGAVIVDRSAASHGVVQDGTLTVAADTGRTAVKLPGLKIRIRRGTPYDSDLPWSHGLFMSSPARALLDNLEPSRTRGGRPSRTLSLAELEDWIASKHIAWGSDRTNRLRVAVRELAEMTGRSEQVALIDSLFEQLAGGEPVRPDAGQLFRAVSVGEAWDERRLRIFNTAFKTLCQTMPPEVPAWLPESDPVGELPFYESYFSNYIEGTTFTVDEARKIIETATPPPERPADGHDILGTYRCVVDPVGRAATSTDPSELIEHLIARHQEIMRGRPDKKPGAWKSKSNRVGGYEFVAPDLVEGTLIRGFEHLAPLPEGLARALYAMIVVSEVHPFEDGNGRVARVMMNAELSAVGASRIVIPNVYRNEYISSLRRTSTADGDLTAFIRVMSYAWRWSAAMPWDDTAATEGHLIATNALLDSTDAEFSGERLELP